MGKVEEVVDNEFLKCCGVPNDQHDQHGILHHLYLVNFTVIKIDIAVL